MAYNKTVWANDTTPDIDAENLNKIENELEYLDKNSSDLVSSCNLFDVNGNHETTGFYDRNNHFYTNASLRTTDYIPVIAGYYYFTNLNANGYILWYSKTKSFLSYTNVNIGDAAQAVSGAYYARFLFTEATKSTFYVGFRNFTILFSEDINKYNGYFPNIIPVLNLFDVNGSNETTGFYDRNNVFQTHATLRSTEKISVLSGGKYFTNLNASGFALWYDEKSGYLGYTDMVIGAIVTAITNACYARFLFTENVKNEFYIGFKRSFKTVADGINDAEEKLSGIGDFSRVSSIYLSTLPISEGYYWGNGGKIAYPGFNAVRDSIAVMPGDIIILHDFGYTGGNAGSACIGMYDEDGSDAPGRVNFNDDDIVTNYEFESNVVKYVRIVIPSGCYRIGLFYSTGGSFSGSPYFTKNNYNITLTNDFKEAIMDEINVEVEEEKAPAYFLKGNANKLPRTKKLCIIGGGQSNMDGRVPVAQLPSYITLPLSGMKYIKNDLTGIFGDGFTCPSGLWAFDLVTCYYLIQNLGNDELYYIKWSQGGTAIDPSATPSTDGHYWTADYEQLPDLSDSLLYQFNSEIQKCDQVNVGEYEIDAMIWHQGENDAGNWHAEENYYDNLKHIIAFCRGIAGNICMPFIFGTIPLASSGYSSVIDAAQRRIAEEDDYVWLVDLKNAQLLDFAHMNAAWCEYFGKKVYDCLIDAGVISGTKLNPSEPE